MNNNQRLTYDGKRLRKAVVRRTIDYSTGLCRYLDNARLNGHRLVHPADRPVIQPSIHHVIDLLPALAYDHVSPVTSVPLKFVHTSSNKVRCPINCVRWTPEGRRMVTGTASGEFTLWNGQTFNFETIQQAHDSAIRQMTWNGAKSWMLSADHQGILKIWTPGLTLAKQLNCHMEAIRDVSFAPSDAKFATCSDDGSIRVWDFAECVEERCLTGHGWDVRNVQWHPYYNLLASGSKDNLLKLWDAKSGANIATIHGHRNVINDVRWNRNGHWLLSAGKDQVIRMHDLRMLSASTSMAGSSGITGDATKEVACFRGHRKEVVSLAWHPVHESLLASGSADGAILFWLADDACVGMSGHGASGAGGPFDFFSAASDEVVQSFSTDNASMHGRDTKSGFASGQRMSSLSGMNTASHGSSNATGMNSHSSFGSSASASMPSTSASSTGSSSFSAPVGGIEYAHDGVIWSLDWHPLGHVLCSGSADTTIRFWTRNRPGDVFNDKFLIGKAASDALGVQDIERANSSSQAGDDESFGGSYGMASLPGLQQKSRLQRPDRPDGRPERDARSERDGMHRQGRDMYDGRDRQDRDAPYRDSFDRHGTGGHRSNEQMLPPPPPPPPVPSASSGAFLPPPPPPPPLMMMPGAETMGMVPSSFPASKASATRKPPSLPGLDRSVRR